MKKYPLNPRMPTPELCIAGPCYAWKCDKHGIMVFGNSAVEAVELWFAAYKREYFD